MNRPVTPADLETTQRVLAAASLRDPRMPRPTDPAAAATAAALAEDLAGIDPDAALAAVSAHYRESPDRIMPAHIWAIVRGSDASRLPVVRTAAERAAVAAQADRIGRPDPPFELEPGEAETAKERALTFNRQISDNWAMPKPTGWSADFGRHSSRREPAPRVSAPFGADTSICFKIGCAVEIKAPAGWDAANRNSPPLFCDRHQPPAGVANVGAA